MNKYTQGNIQDIRKAAADFRTETVKACQTYRHRLQKAHEEAKQYKDETGYIQQKKSAAAREARLSIQSARYGFQATAKYAIDGLREEMKDHITQSQPDKGFYEKLRVYRDFNLQPDELEAKALIEQSHGSPLAVRALNSVLEQTKAEYRVTIPNSGEYEKDLKALERLLAPSVIPNVDTDLHAELYDIFNGQPMYKATNEAGDPIDTGWRFDDTSLVQTTFGFDADLQNLDGMERRWTSSVLPSLTRNLATKETMNKSRTQEQALTDYATELQDTQTTAAQIEHSGNEAIQKAQQLAQSKKAVDAATLASYAESEK